MSSILEKMSAQTACASCIFSSPGINIVLRSQAIDWKNLVGYTFKIQLWLSKNEEGKKNRKIAPSCDSYLNICCIVCMHCLLCIVFYVMYFMYCILCIVLYVLYSMHCILCVVFYPFYSLHCIQSLSNFKTRCRQTDRHSDRIF
jgi:hypothetical protein